MEPKYKRILLKLSGEVLAGEKGVGLNNDCVLKYCKAIKKCVDAGVQVAIVVGGGNFWRGRSSGDMDRVHADHIGMLATVMNAIALGDGFEQLGVPVRVMTSIEVSSVAEPFSRLRALKHLESGKVVVFGGGTGCPFFSTDTAAALRAAEIDADAIFKATKVDGVYDSDPKKNPDAKRFDEITYTEVLQRNLQVLDSTATAMCKDNRMPLFVFSLEDTDNICKAAMGEDVGTTVKED